MFFAIISTFHRVAQWKWLRVLLPVGATHFFVVVFFTLFFLTHVKFNVLSVLSVPLHEIQSFVTVLPQ